MSNFESSMFLVDDSFMYEPDDIFEDSWDSQDQAFESLAYEPEPDDDPETDPGPDMGLSVHDLDNSYVVNDEFDWREAVPGNVWSPHALASSQSSSCGSSKSTLSPTGSLLGKRTRVPGNPDALSQGSIEAALGASCGCRVSERGRSCMSSFNIGDVFRLRHGRHKMAFSEAMAMKSSDLQQALVNGTAACRLNVEGKQVCLQAYCMLYNLNWSSMRRSWAALVYGRGRGVMGRPRGSSGGVLSSPKGLQAYSWLKAWMEVAGDEDPVGLKYKYVVNYVLPADLYEEYCADHLTYQVHGSDETLSCRAFARVWALFKKDERVRVRRKANTTTKCQGNPIPSPCPPLFVLITQP